MNTVIASLAGLVLGAVTAVTGVQVAAPDSPAPSSPGAVVSYADE